MSKKLALLSLSLILAISMVLLLITRVNVRAQEGSFGKQTYGEEDIGPEMGESSMFVDKESTQIMKYLKPTIKQRQKLHKINMDFLKDTIDLNNEEGQKLLKRHELMEEDTIDLKKVDQLTDEISVIRAELHKKRIRKRLAIRKILTSEQKEKYDELRGYRGTARPGFLGRGFGPGRGQGRFRGM